MLNRESKHSGSSRSFLENTEADRPAGSRVPRCELVEEWTEEGVEEGEFSTTDGRRLLTDVTFDPRG